jgi:endonuclease-3
MADARKIAQLLLKRYPSPGLALDFSTPLDLLVATILSAQCTDARVNEVTKNLFKKYRNAEDYAKADIKRFEEEIRPTGFYKNKARMIIECCKKIVRDYNGNVPDSLEGLTGLPGVGRKTANMVLGSAFGRQTMAVDTHVLRVSKRLGLTTADKPDRVEEDLVKQFPGTRLTKINLAMILHGRGTCTAKRPKCHECVLYKECEWPDKPGL